MSNWNRVFKPIVVLCVICIVITGALAATNAATAPVIAAATEAAQNAARNELLPEANGAFTKVEGVAVDNVTDVYAADNGAGWVITSNSKGYGGTIGSKVAGTPSYWERYQGQSAGGQLKITKDGGTIDGENSATISSRALARAVSSAIEAYNAIP